MKKVRVLKGCVACGSCSKVCAVCAIKVYNGVAAKVDKNKCVGCGKCTIACPAGILALTLTEDIK